MAQIENTGNRWVKIQGVLTDIDTIKHIEKQSLGYDEIEGYEGGCTIVITPKEPSKVDVESGSNGSYNILYKEETERDLDFEIIEGVLKGK